MLKAPVINKGVADARELDWYSRNMTFGNVCRMRIIIDKFLLILFINNKEQMKSYVKYFEVSLNDIYEEAGVSVRVNRKQVPLKFKVVDLQFHDEDYCRRKRNSQGSSQHYDIRSQLLTDLFVAVSCKSWTRGEDEAMLEAHATTDHSDVCLSYLFTSHDFDDVLGNISQSKQD